MDLGFIFWKGQKFEQKESTIENGVLWGIFLKKKLFLIKLRILEPYGKFFLQKMAAVCANGAICEQMNPLFWLSNLLHSNYRILLIFDTRGWIKCLSPHNEGQAFQWCHQNSLLVGGHWTRYEK